jgi:hypothetical protein
MADLLSPSNRTAGNTWVASYEEAAGVQTVRIEPIKLIHELGSDLVGGTIRKDCLIDPSDMPTLVSIESRVVTDAARTMNSPEYLASVRRRVSIKIKSMLGSLSKKARRDDFEAFTFRVVEEIRELLAQLTDIHREGNTREILRQTRDTFLNGGHERYREEKARMLVASIFERLSDADEVTAEDVDQVWDELYDNGLASPLPAVFVVEEGSE